LGARKEEGVGRDVTEAEAREIKIVKKTDDCKKGWGCGEEVVGKRGNEGQNYEQRGGTKRPHKVG